MTQFIQEQIASVQPAGTAPGQLEAVEPPRSILLQQDPLYAAAVAIVLDARRASTSFVQRRLKLGYNRAERLMERMQQEGLVASPGPGGNRELLVTTAEQYDAMLTRFGSASSLIEHRNVEIKARVPDLAPLEAMLAKRTGRAAEVLSQRDFFFHCPRGRLKLRIEGNNVGRAAPKAQLIHYHRADQDGARLSRYSITAVAEHDGLLDVLAAAYGVTGQVSKIRWLFELGRTRVHLDLVNGLGYFVELEVRLNEGKSVEDGEREAYALLDEFGVARQACLKGGYHNYWPLHPDRATALELPELAP